MRFTDALAILRGKPSGAPRFPVVLACGFTPLHLRTFLEAHLQQALSTHCVEINAGLYGDLQGTAEALAQSPAQAAAIAIEWQDLDPRLGFRATGGWSPSDLPDILATVRQNLGRLERALAEVPDALRIAVSLPGLPLAPVFYTSAGQAGEAELMLMESVAAFARAIAARPNTAVVNPGKLAEQSPPGTRFDLKSDLFTGLPYTMAHADAVGGALAALLHTPPPMKAVITDLDDTLWAGILGDAGPENVAWDLSSHAQLHGLYQQLLRALADQGVLVAIASKNDPGIVDKAFMRSDILLPRDRIFPIEAGWGAKSAAISRILQIWNIGVSSVIFVDDSPMELAEVAEAHPGIRCVRFPKDDYAAAASFFRDLRGWFGKASISQEDTLRRESIRQSAAFRELVEENEAPPESFLAGMQACLSMDFEGAVRDARVLELVNKTNQFNLNGARYTEAEWQAAQTHPGAFAVSAAYRDRFGPLGKIAVLAGRSEGDTLRVTVWVMSCRAFARRVEHQCIHQLFHRTGARAILFDFAATPRNGPLQDFFASLGVPPDAPLERQAFEAACPPLYQTVEFSE